MINLSNVEIYIYQGGEYVLLRFKSTIFFTCSVPGTRF